MRRYLLDSNTAADFVARRGLVPHQIEAATGQSR
jgi:hypothetical protein